MMLRQLVRFTTFRPICHSIVTRNASNLSDPQFRKAVAEKSIEIRRQRAQFKDSISKGTLDPIAALDQATQDKKLFGKILVSQFLRAIPGIGPATAEEIYRVLNFEAGARLIGLSPQEVTLLKKVIVDRGSKK